VIIQPSGPVLVKEAPPEQTVPAPNEVNEDEPKPEEENKKEVRAF